VRVGAEDEQRGLGDHVHRPGQLATGQIIPFHDKPIITPFSVSSALSTLGTLGSTCSLIGFVRNM
jgi:hypothetical protein